MTEPLSSTLVSAGSVLAAMTVVAVVEAAIPLRIRGKWNADHLAPNLAMTLITLGSNILIALPLVTVLAWLQKNNLGVMSSLAVPPLLATAIGIVLLDFAAYVGHVTMHRVPLLWRFHRVHHSDPTLDVTTALRQHPGETLIRHAFMAGCAIGLGVDPRTLAIYRTWQAINALLEHANISLPTWLDHLLAFVVVSPNMHKVHHSRVEEFTNTNYGNIFSFFDRMFFSFTPVRCAREIPYGLDGYDDPTTQRTTSLLVLPFTGPGPRASSTVALATRQQA
jgi:sterol desaturase/sphingolipid hydroxylase (fatty acid hydroxylase superfamily)